MKSENKVFKPHVVLLEGQVWTTSIVVALHFGKRHDNVLRDIDAVLSEIPEEFHRLNFEEMYRQVNIDNGAVRRERMYRMTRDGFVLIAMGFTGEKALARKVAYIQSFNAMEQASSRRITVAAAPRLNKEQVESEDLIQNIAQQRNDDETRPGLGDFVIPDVKRLLH